ncbi:hypothetical protein [Mesobacillus foraminis]|uniref:hypothetical protein n=1 Tax=Mesobacillus foraminis TaxID=279826 RepID=UPI000EF49B54|nr:hypothetical protein [Mesobacillus foraminis]
MSKKTNVSLIMCIIIAMFLVGCINKASNEFDISQLSRVDIEVVQEDGSYGEAEMITDEETVDAVRKAFKQIKWEPNVEPKMARKEDIKATLFFKYDENMPERLFEYQIWFIHNNDTATMISNNEKEGYGTLEKDNAQILESIFFNN